MDEAVAAFWARAAGTYETEVPYFGLMGERIVARAGLRAGQEVLDVACGKGATLIPAARAVGDRGRVVGVDIVPEMVDAARAAAAGAGLANVAVQVGDGEALDIDSASVDVVVCGFGLGFLRPERALPEMRRVLRDGGRLVTSVPMGGGRDWDFFGELCKRYGLVSEAHVGGAAMPPFDEMAELAASAGLFLDPPMAESVSVLFPDEESWWRWSWSHGQRAFLERLDDSQVDAFKEQAFAALRSFRTSDGIPLEQQFLVLTANT
jgi:SAM-dependent methyltransferase